MAIDIGTEALVSLTEATKLLPPLNGRRPSISSLWRWCRRGVRGVKLEYVRVGRSLATSREALNRFFEALAAADAPEDPPRPTPPAPGQGLSAAARKRSLDEADRILAEAGL